MAEVQRYEIPRCDLHRILEGHVMAEVQRYESMVPMRYVVLQGRGHGPVLVRSPGLTTATCLQCEWHGCDRGGLPSWLIEADGEQHLQDVEDAQVSG